MDLLAKGNWKRNEADAEGKTEGQRLVARTVPGRSAGRHVEKRKREHEGGVTW
jgi:hypothetical protein